jgi:energy-coupling factor transporter transmembrane protein EcfT
MIPAYILCIIAFLLLALLKPSALYFLITGALLTLLIEWRYITHMTFSLVVLLLFIYHIIMIVLLISEQIPARLIKARQLKEAEEAEWRGKI